MNEKPNDRFAERLVGWKAIGRHLGRDARTAQRWAETRDLPVQYAPGGARRTVFAHVRALDDWLHGATADDADTHEDAAAIDAAAIDSAKASTAKTSHKRRWPLVMAVVAALAAGTAFYVNQPSATPANSTAQTLYSNGLYSWSQRTPISLARAQDSFTRAIVADPQFAPAYAGLANVYNLLREFSAMPDAVAYPRAKAAALRAIALDDRLASAHAALAFVAFYGEGDTASALREFERAISLEPDAALNHHWYANALAAIGKLDQALHEIDRAAALDPASTAIRADRGMILHNRGDTVAAKAVLQALIEADPNARSAYAYLAQIALENGDDAAYITNERRSARLKQDSAEIARINRAELGLKLSGRRGMLTAMRDDTAAIVAQTGHGYYALAVSEMRLGNQRAVDAALAQARAQHDPSLLYFAYAKEFAAYRAGRAKP